MLYSVENVLKRSKPRFEASIHASCDGRCESRYFHRDQPVDISEETSVAGFSETLVIVGLEPRSSVGSESGVDAAGSGADMMIVVRGFD